MNSIARPSLPAQDFAANHISNMFETVLGVPTGTLGHDLRDARSASKVASAIRPDYFDMHGEEVYPELISDPDAATVVDFDRAYRTYDMTRHGLYVTFYRKGRHKAASIFKADGTYLGSAEHNGLTDDCGRELWEVLYTEDSFYAVSISDAARLAKLLFTAWGTHGNV